MKFKERDWRRLMRDIADRKVIPVIGPELLPVIVDGKEINLFRHVTNQLIETNEVDVEALPEDYGFDDVIEAILIDPENEREDLYFDIREVLERVSWPTPEPLKKLAAISHLRFFLTTTVDSLMTQALNEVRFGGESKTLSLAYCTKSEVTDFADNFRPGKIPAVFQFFGKLNAVNDFAIIDEDILEFARRLQSPYHRPNNLFDSLRGKRVLLLGCSFPGWLTRFFLCAVKGESLFIDHTHDMLADKLSAENSHLVTFLERNKMAVYSEGDAVPFVDELHRRWVEEFGDVELDEEEDEDEAAEDDGGGATPAKKPPTKLSDIKPDSVFISYHSGDRPVAIEIAKAFEGAGIDIWFDQSELVSGDDYRRKIEANIEKCSYFFPVISRLAVGGERRFLYLEWNKAIDEAKFRPKGYPFIQPIIVDDTSPEHESIPREFREYNCQWLKDLPKVVELTKQRIRELRRAGKAA